ncbi:MAG: galactokinase [Planctomycetes bacterium]|nr:galactokinase [Planctomycetota bacterium]
MTPENSRKGLLERLEGRFRAEFGGAAPRCFFAPGRINLLGAHLDYSGGDVLPMAIDRGIYAAARARSDGRLRLVSLDQELVVEVHEDDVGLHTRPEWGWAGYPLGVWQGLRHRYGIRGGFELVVGGDMAMASGLSSSAAIEVATAVALDAVYGLGLSRQDIAVISHAAETGFVGVRCGIMDQFASALAQPGKVLLLHCAGPSYEHVPFDGEACDVLVLDTKKPRELAKSGFNQRVAECASAREILCTHVRDLPHLALFTPEDLLRAEAVLSDVLFRRARHVVTEMVRVKTGVAALREHDYRKLGQQLTASHLSGATDYEVTCDELDEIAEAAISHESVFGVRFTGAGFGGCAIALHRPGAAPEVEKVVTERFEARFGVTPGFDLLRIGMGPGEVER